MILGLSLRVGIKSKITIEETRILEQTLLAVGDRGAQALCEVG